jgi:hypothetical protein
MLRAGIGLVLSALLASGCIVRETYSVPYAALHTLNSMDPAQVKKTGVPAIRDSGTGSEAFVRADKLDSSG